MAYINDKRIGQMNPEMDPYKIVEIVSEELADMLRLNLGRSYRSDEEVVCW